MVLLSEWFQARPVVGIQENSITVIILDEVVGHGQGGVFGVDTPLELPSMVEFSRVTTELTKCMPVPWPFCTDLSCRSSVSGVRINTIGCPR